MFIKKLLTGANDGTALVSNLFPSLIFISLRIEHKHLAAMIDTGATASLITLSTLNELKYADRIRYEVGEVILGDSKTKIHRHGWIYLYMMIGGVCLGMDVMVVDQLTTSFILGVDFLRKFNVDIKMQQRQLHIHRPYGLIQVDFLKRNLVRLKDKCTILPRCRAVLVAKLDMVVLANTMLLQSIDQQTQLYKRIRLSDGLVNVMDNSIEVTVYNPTTRVVTLPRNMCLGNIDYLSEDHYMSTLINAGTNTEIDIHESKKKKVKSLDVIVENLCQHLGDNTSHHEPIVNLIRQHNILFDTSQTRTIKTPIRHVINTGDHPPVNARPYFKKLEQRNNIQQEIDKMLKNGLISPSNSPWSSPVVLLKKPNGEFRFIIDYRKLNSITKKDSYPQTTVEELLQRVGGHAWFTKLDLKSGYYQIPIHPPG